MHPKNSNDVVRLSSTPRPLGPLNPVWDMLPKPASTGGNAFYADSRLRRHHAP